MIDEGSIARAHDSDFIVQTVRTTLVCICAVASNPGIGIDHLSRLSIIHTTPFHSALNCRRVRARKPTEIFQSFIISISSRVVSIHPLTPAAVRRLVFITLISNFIILAISIRLLTVGAVAPNFGIGYNNLWVRIIPIILPCSLNPALDGCRIITNTPLVAPCFIITIS